MSEEAHLEAVDSGLAPVTDGWFVLNVRDAAWLTNDAFGARCVFEGDKPVLRRRPDLEGHRFADIGFTLAVVEPGKPSDLYHAETNKGTSSSSPASACCSSRARNGRCGRGTSCTARPAPRTPSSGPATAGA